MKKFILPILLFLMFIPFVVNAETCDTDKITISSINIENKSNGVEELDETTVSGKNINLNLSMNNLGDSITYKFVVKNESNEDYELNKTSLNLNTDYINYSFVTDDNSNIINANSSKTVFLKVEYKKEVPDEEFESGAYNVNQSMTLNLSTGNSINILDTLKNPNTGNSFLILSILILIITVISFIILKKTKYVKYMILIIGIIMTIPMNVYAICKGEIKVESKIQITPKEKINISGEIIWDDHNNKDNLRPESVVISLYANDELVETKEITIEDNWSYIFYNLLKYEMDNTEIIYTVSIADVDNYEKIVEGNNIKLIHNPKFICKRANTLHTEICNNSGYSTSVYCRAEYSYMQTINYGKLGTKGTKPKPGDAFDCDVNNDGLFNSDTERFYYVSKEVKESAENAILIYYINVANGNPITNNEKYPYASTADLKLIDSSIQIYDNIHGPVTAYKQLPSTQQWSNPMIILPGTRQIVDENNDTTTRGGTIQQFTYANKAARLLTIQEVDSACGLSTYHKPKYLTNCNYFLENTGYTNITNKYIDWWLETPANWNESYAMSIAAGSRWVIDNFVFSEGGVRPAITVKLSDIDY